MSNLLAEIDPYQDITHPLDFIEDVSRLNNWDYKRLHEDKMTLNVICRFQTYKMQFIWDQELETLRLNCGLEMMFDQDSEDLLPRTLMDLNARLWLGQFIYGGERKLSYTHTILFRSAATRAEFDCIEELIRIAAQECDRFYPLFHMLSQQDIQDKDRLFLALTDCEGVA